MYYQGNNHCLHLHVLTFIYTKYGRKYRIITNMYRNICKNNFIII